MVREAVAGPDQARRASGYQALFNWPDATVADDLAKLAETTTDKDLKTTAVQELARVVVLPGPLSDDERLWPPDPGFKRREPRRRRSG